MKQRIIFDLIIFFLALVTPWWFSIVFVAVGAFVFKFYFEAILFGVIMDLLYGSATSFGYGMVGLVLSLVIFLVMPCVNEAVRPAYRASRQLPRR